MEDDVDNGTRGVGQPGAGASSSRGLRHNPSETRGAPLLTGSTKLVGQAFEKNRNVIWSWLTDDEVSTIGIYGIGGSGKTTKVKHIYNKLLQSPNISNHVYWVTVSQDFSIHKLQNTIAKHIQLSFSNEVEELGQRAICRQMTSKNNVRVNPLSKEEAWTLFMEVLGHDRSLSPQVKQVARDITKECAGLPLGIKMIAGTMKAVHGMHEWSDALEDLKQSKVPQDRVEQELCRNVSCIVDYFLKTLRSVESIC
ncbi:disease resistance protein [Salix suchowensis]|nr:disease resistance protein [Salix suchowensis]